MKLSLNGDWQARSDPDNIGQKEKWYTTTWPESSTFSLKVPGIWQNQRSGLKGAVWYEKKFSLPEGGQRGHCILKIEASNFRTDVWINGNYLGRHEGGYTPFTFHLKNDFLKTEENRLVIRVADVIEDEVFDGLVNKKIPAGKEHWYYQVSGIWQPVEILIKNNTWLKDIRVIPDPANKEFRWILKVGSRRKMEEKLTVAIKEKDQIINTEEKTLSLHPGSQQIEGIINLDNIVYWSPQNPYLYQVSFTLSGSGDEADINCGFRNIDMIDGHFRLNGEKIMLKTVLLQPHYPEELLKPSRPEVVKKQFQAAKEAGFNMVRFHLLPHEPYVLDLADEMGLLVYAETPIGWIKESKQMEDYCLQEIEEMIKRDWNHPSVVIWGLGNENVMLAQKFGSRMLKQAAALDPTRIAIDNSGGTGAIDQFFAWTDKARYFIPGEGIKNQADLHLYLGQVEDVLFNWLRKLGEPEEMSSLLKTGYGLPQDLEQLTDFFSNYKGGIHVSEYGFGGCENLWQSAASFAPDSLNPDRELLEKYGASLEQILTGDKCKDIFREKEDFIKAAEKIHGQTIFDQTMIMRLNPRISGYGLTQLNDSSWEFGAGILNRWRQKKPSFNYIKRANNEIQIFLWPERYCYTKGEDVCCRIWLVAERPVQGKVQLTWDDNCIYSEEITGRGTILVTSKKVKAEEVGSFTVKATFTTSSNNTRVDQRQIRIIKPVANVKLQKLTGQKNIKTTGSNSNIMLYSCKEKEQIDWHKVFNLVRKGKSLILINLNIVFAEIINEIDVLPFKLRVRKAIKNWMPTWHFVPEHPVFDGLPTKCLADRFYAPVLPNYSWENPSGKIVAPSIRANIHCGEYRDSSYEFQVKGDLVITSLGEGTLVVCQYQIDKNNPIANTLLSNLLTYIKTKS